MSWKWSDSWTFLLGLKSIRCLTLGLTLLIFWDYVLAQRKYWSIFCCRLIVAIICYFYFTCVVTYCLELNFTLVLANISSSSTFYRAFFEVRGIFSEHVHTMFRNQACTWAPLSFGQRLSEPCLTFTIHVPPSHRAIPQNSMTCLWAWQKFLQAVKSWFKHMAVRLT